MFERREKRDIVGKLRSFFWPAAGFRRAGIYMMHRLSRIPGTPYTLACGFACGAAASFTPFVGLHFILATALAWVLRGNILASAIGTVVGNPWTFPFIWVWLYYLGNWMGVGESEIMHTSHLNFPRLFGQLTEALLNGDLSRVIEIARPVWWPMFIGGIPSSIAVWFVFYFPLSRIVKSYQLRRRKRLRNRKRTRSEGSQ